MAKKTWIKVKRGILEPKHIDQLGAAWYLYLYILDQADWETGKIFDWKDKFASDELGKSIGLIREHRKHLQDCKYIKCEQGLHKQIITIHNWIDPRRYDGVVQNEEINDSDNSQPLEVDDSYNGSPHGEVHGSPHGFKNPEQNDVSSYSHISHITCQDNAPVSPIQRMIEKKFGLMPTTPSDSKSLDELESLGVIEDDVAGAVDWFNSQNKVARYFASVINPIKFQANKRIQSAGSKPDKEWNLI